MTGKVSVSKVSIEKRRPFQDYSYNQFRGGEVMVVWVGEKREGKSNFLLSLTEI